MGEEVKTDAEKAAEFKAPTSQEEFDRMVGARLERERSKFADYEDVKAKAEKFDKAIEADKSELQKERERAEKAESALTPAQQQVARLEVAIEKGLTVTQAKRLVGTTKDEFTADAEELLSDLGAKATKPKADVKKLKSGAAGDGENNTGKERAAAAIRQLRGN